MTFMSNSPMSRGVRVGVASYDPAAATYYWCMDGADIQRKRDALRSELAVIEEARRRLEEAHQEAAAGEPHLDVVLAAGAESSSDDFYPLDDDEVEEEEEEEEGSTIMQWQDQVCRQMMVNTTSLHRHHDDENIAGSDHRHDNVINLDDDDIDGDEISRDIVVLGLHVPHIQHHAGTGVPIGETADGGGGGFGAVPASAAAIAGLGKQRYDGSSGDEDDGTCVICMREYKKGRRLRVMPCAHKHRFHGRCIRKWLSRSNACPLCRHALPTAADEQQGGGGVHRRRAIVRVNVNPY